MLIISSYIVGSQSTTGRQEVVAEYFAKCWLCSKGFPSASVLRDHLQSVHNESPAAAAAAMAAVQPPPPLLPPSSSAIPTAAAAAAAAMMSSSSSSSPPPPPPPPQQALLSAAAVGHKHQHTCLQCAASFSERDELERHELTHSPTAQVVSRWPKKINSPPPHFPLSG